jgi:transposase
LAASTVADGLQRLEPLFTPVYQALKERNGQSFYRQADETRWHVFVDHEGRSNHCWWLWAFSGLDTVVYCLDPSRSHTVPETYYPTMSKVVSSSTACPPTRPWRRSKAASFS